MNPRAEFFDKLQRELEEHNQDLERKYDGDLNTTLIFVSVTFSVSLRIVRPRLPYGFVQSGLFSAVASAFAINIQPELKPDYQQMNNALLEMILNATTETPPVGSPTLVPRWAGPDPTIVQVQSMLYATLSATLLAAFLAMLGKQWLNRYKQNETRGSVVDRSRVCEMKLAGLETWKFHIIMESLPLILQCALALLGFALSQYLWKVNTSVSSVVISFTGFGLLFYSFIIAVSVLSFNCPFQTPFSLLIRSMIDLTTPYWLNLLSTFRSTQQPFQLGMLQTRFDLPLFTDEFDQGQGGIALPPSSITPLFIQENDLEGDVLDARCIDRLFEMSTNTDVTTSIMGFIPEVIWHSGVKKIPLQRIYNTLVDCFDFSGAHPVVVPKSRDIAYLSAKAFVHIALQRRCITQHEEHAKKSSGALCAGHRLLSSARYHFDSDLAAVLFMVDMTLGYDIAFSWEELEMTPPHRAWMSHVFLYRAWHEGKVSDLVIDFVEDSLSLESPSDAVISDCLLIIGLTIGVTFHVNDITVKDKRLDLNFARVSFTDSLPSSRKKVFILAKIFGALTQIFSSKPTQTQSALRALRLIIRLSNPNVHFACHLLFSKIMASDDLEDQHWEAARLAIRGALRGWPAIAPKGIFKFLAYHVGLQGAQNDLESSFHYALLAITFLQEVVGIDLLTHEGLGDFDWTSPSFVRGVRSVMEPDNPVTLRERAADLIVALSGTWFKRSASIMEPEDMAEFCEDIAILMDEATPTPRAMKRFVTILFGMLSSPFWRNHIVTRFWSVLAHCNLVEELGSVRWCLQNATELLGFTRGLSCGEGLRWWYGTLWFHYDKLDNAAREEVKRMAVDMLHNDGLSDLNLYLGLIREEIARIRREINRLAEGERLRVPCGKMKARLVALDGNYHQLTRITVRR